MKKRKTRKKKDPLFNIDKSTYNYWLDSRTSNPSKIKYSIVNEAHNFPNDSDTKWYITNTPIYIYRRVIWRDVKNNLQNLLTIMRDFLLDKSRSFLENSDSVSSLTSSTSGCMVKPAQPYTDATETPVKLKRSLESTNMTSSDGSQVKRRGSRQYGTKFGADGKPIHNHRLDRCDYGVRGCKVRNTRRIK